jgi:hypothetical protein
MQPIDRSTCPGRQHGTRTAYHNHGCRCADAREAQRIALKRKREGRATSDLVPAIGTARRLQSLVASGYRQSALAPMLGVSGQRVNCLITPARHWVTRPIEAAVKALFRQIDGTDGGSQYARTTARRNGWVDAAAWDNIDDPDEEPKVDVPDVDVGDPVLVERVLEGQRINLSPANRRLAVTVGLERRIPLYEIGQRLHVSHTTVRELAAA